MFIFHHCVANMLMKGISPFLSERIWLSFPSPLLSSQIKLIEFTVLYETIFSCCAWQCKALTHLNFHLLHGFLHGFWRKLKELNYKLKFVSVYRLNIPLSIYACNYFKRRYSLSNIILPSIRMVALSQLLL